MKCNFFEVLQCTPWEREGWIQGSAFVRLGGNIFWLFFVLFFVYELNYLSCAPARSCAFERVPQALRGTDAQNPR